MKEFFKNMLRAFVPPPQTKRIVGIVVLGIVVFLIVGGYFAGLLLMLTGFLSSVWMVILGDIEQAKACLIVAVVSAFVFSFCYALMKHFNIEIE